MFWETADNVRNILVSKAMRKLDGRDNKMGKIRSLLDFLSNKFIANAPDCKNISVDEAMMPYFGRHGCKQFLRLKPERFGFKVEYCLAADFYQGRNPNCTKPGDQSLGESIGFRSPSNSTILFTNTKLICSLSEKGMKGTGTAIIKWGNAEVMQKRERGYYKVHTEENKGISAVAWRDSNAVYTLLQPVQYANRYISKDKKSFQVTQPNVIHKYNKFKGGDDLLDKNISNYRIGIHEKNGI
ncbi:hypothetical protein PR048_023701 [Dryococelus australis]|uniref:PiggyBac transposable element-derived protein domain-containing protein n=1 Tax=Dryococelus australis TaxID=614101 RepID=A0ABQ9GUS8_9NEOP|nr:hypothetical protein PR048_023701 [Dryococelus australis]